MRKIQLFILLSVLFIILGLSDHQLVHTHAQAGGWQYQVGLRPDSGANNTTNVYTTTVYRTTYGFYDPPGDNTYEASYWNSGNNAAYSPDFYQVGCINVNGPSGATLYAFLQTTAATQDPNGNHYVVCECGNGMSPSIGANGQSDGGCMGYVSDVPFHT